MNNDSIKPSLPPHNVPSTITRSMASFAVIRKGTVRQVSGRPIPSSWRVNQSSTGPLWEFKRSLRLGGLNGWIIRREPEKVLSLS